MAGANILLIFKATIFSPNRGSELSLMITQSRYKNKQGLIVCNCITGKRILIAGGGEHSMNIIILE